MLQGALEPAADEPRVEGVVAVLNEHGAVGEAQERAARVFEHRRADEHGAVDVVAPARVGVDRRPAVDQRVEKGKRALEREALGAKLEDEEWSIARGLDVEGDELRLVERRRRVDVGRVDGDLLPGDRRGRATWLEVDLLLLHRATRSARRAQAISSRVTARSRTAATA